MNYFVFSQLQPQDIPPSNLFLPNPRQLFPVCLLQKKEIHVHVA